MAYLHCHQCHWEQDDFWSFKIYRNAYGKLRWSYNPIQTFFNYIKTFKLWIPRMIEREKGGAKNNDFCRYKTFSWFMFFEFFWTMVRNFWNMEYWTYEAWIKEYRKGWGRCPKCMHDLCLD